MTSIAGRGRWALVIGLGVSGRSAARLLLAQGWRVRGADDRPGLALEGVEVRAVDDPVIFHEIALVVASPGVRPDHTLVRSAMALGVEILGEVGLAALCIDRPVIGITGTNGKSTVTHFTGQILDVTLPGRTFVGGNLGTPLCDGVLEGGWDRYVVELSSYQLERIGTLRPSAAVVLNLTPDHLARHGDMDGYALAKLRIGLNQSDADWLLLPATDARLARLDTSRARHGRLGASPGVIRQGRSARICLGDLDVTLDLSGVTVPGAHNLDHAATAATLGILVGADPAAVEAAFAGLTALPHRMQIVHEADGVVWIDDSKATNPEAAAVGVSGLDRPAVVLLGGQAKGGGFDALISALGQPRAIIAFGGDGPLISAALDAAGREHVLVPWLADAVREARVRARSGDAVLLSPACASFDEFSNFGERGEVFARLAALGG